MNNNQELIDKLYALRAGLSVLSMQNDKIESIYSKILYDIAVPLSKRIKDIMSKRLDTSKYKFILTPTREFAHFNEFLGEDTGEFGNYNSCMLYYKNKKYIDDPYYKRYNSPDYIMLEVLACMSIYTDDDEIKLYPKL